ncbi:hypothetical protein M9980_02420 [Sphingomonas donggukensis]|uniref:Antitoxin Xre/MbcA/ParS-like toxin-binding domain-containing protein n=1 Tax=Sphingomonas donggukensis TaxID=2949093 RepID=A0ABY4TUN8_9SPHN|nr:hypothetical protein [Sphingomonas donggukensis]URW76106.1 hypothetical protein M9980_02420 [Sphingomonas donggukensis]
MPDTDDMPVPAPAPSLADKPVTKKFRRHTTERVAPEIASRQGRIAGLAWQKLGGRDAAMAFLNDHDATLGARPLDVAIASDAGYDTVAALIADRARPA